MIDHEFNVLEENNLNPEPYFNNSIHQVGWVFGKKKKYVIAMSKMKWRALKDYKWYWYKDINELLIKLNLIEQERKVMSFKLGDEVRKTKGSQWQGIVVGTYSTTLTPEGYAVESNTEKGSVQIYPVGTLEIVNNAH